MINEMTEKKLYPLTYAQKLHFFTLRYCPKKQVLNIGTSLTIKEDINIWQGELNIIKDTKEQTKRFSESCPPMPAFLSRTWLQSAAFREQLSTSVCSIS